MLPPPITRASSTPSARISSISSARPSSTRGAMPNPSSPRRISPESLSRTLRKRRGGWAVIRSSAFGSAAWGQALDRLSQSLAAGGQAPDRLSPPLRSSQLGAVDREPVPPLGGVAEYVAHEAAELDVLADPVH